jgi:hypothetical protein
MRARYDIGFDFGNGETSAVISSSSGENLQWITLPSFVGRGSLSELARFRGMTRHFEHPSEALKAGEYVLHDGHTECFVGHLALSQGHLATSARGDSSRYWSEHALQLLLTVAGALIPDPVFELDLVTGIPIQTYQQATRQNVKDLLEGEHRYRLNGEERRAVINVSAVIMEGAGALIAYGRNETIPQAALDVGSRTTDLYTAEGHVPLTPFCRGTPLGVDLAADAISEAVEETYGRALTQQERRALLRAHVGNGAYPTIFVDGQPLEQSLLEHWTEEALRRVGREIATFAAQVWQSSEQGRVATHLAQVLLIGGGAYYFYHDLVARIPHLIVPVHPELGNALGYRALAEQVRLQREAA